MAKIKRKIIIVKDDFSAAEVAEESVGKEIKSASFFDAVSTMATDFEPDKTSVLSNPELGLVFAEMTDAQAKNLVNKPGVESIEDDEVVYAYGCDDLDDFNAMGPEFLDEDDDATQEIDEAMADIMEQDFDEMVPEDAVAASQIIPDLNEIDIDEAGNVISMDETCPEQVFGVGIPRDKILALIKCVLKCAAEQFSGKVQDVSDEKIGEILATLNLPADSEGVSATRDYITCGLRIIYAPQAWRYNKGRGVRVAVVDTGIAPRHPDLRVYGGASFVPGVTRWHDDHYHGTHVAGTIAASMNNRGVVGVAPDARLYAVKVLNKKGQGYTSWILNGLTWCHRHNMHIVNLSLGSGASNHTTTNYSKAYEKAGAALRKRGILPVAAAGNSGNTSKPYVGNPGRCPSFMAVSSVDCKRRRSSFSSYGPQVEICAPGSSVMSTYPPNGYKQLSGTSMAAPHVAGVAALVKRRHPTWSGDRIRVHLWRTAMDLGRPGRDWFFGYGQVRAYHAVR